MGIELVENFRFPYLVQTPQAFWRNWHISLSTWLRDYLYIPLGGSRGARWKTRRNLFVTMALGGLWHGAAWTFVLWGMYQGLLLIVYRAADEWRRDRNLAPLGQTGGRLAAFVRWAVMFHLTCYGWLVFRAQSLGQIASLSRDVVTQFSPAAADIQGLMVPLLLYTTPLIAIHALEAHYDDLLVVRRLPVTARYNIYAATAYLVVLFGNFGGAEFIYFQF
jgi:D-alanyl-lipoteichoic acid acyltransferase DltB (MBOAT superfamily)